MILVIVGIFVFLVGLCIGSFLNVVVYRLPRELSVAGPRWSFCPACEHQLAWHDNIPVLSWLMLRGRCRYCVQPISVQYPLVEALTALCFTLAWFLLGAHEARVGLGAEPHQVALYGIAAAWFALLAGLVACAALDIISYMIDTRVTNTVVVLALVIHTLSQHPQSFVATTTHSVYVACAVAFAVGGIQYLVGDWLTARAPAAEDNDALAHADTPNEAPATTDGNPGSTSARANRLTGVIATLLMILLALACVAQPVIPGAAGIGAFLAPAAIATLFLVMVFTSGQPRAADAELESAIEDESAGARGAIFNDLVWLLPSIIAGLAVYLFAPGLGEWAASLRIGAFQPLSGLIYALGGAAVGATAGWIIRIVFTLVFGREAFGVGDIFILAAAGAAAGADIALLGFFLSIPIALLSWMLSLAMKRSVMIAFGPPLALGFVAALWLNAPALDLAGEYRKSLNHAWDTQRRLVVVLGVAMLVGSAASVWLAKLIRRLVEPEEDAATDTPAETAPSSTQNERDDQPVG